MTTEEKAKAYDEAIERARRIKNGEDNWRYSDLTEIIPALEEVLPELAESEDERMMREFNYWLCEEIECLTNDLRDEKDRRTLNMLCYVLTKVKDWLEKQKDVNCLACDQYLKGYLAGRKVTEEEKQKEQKPEEGISQLAVQGKGVYKICPRCKERMVRDDSMVYTSMPPQYRYECPKCGESECDTVMYDNPEMEEQKPNSTEDMPYITDEHFYEREPADSFKYKLAEYMTRCCTKKEGPYGYEYGISAESILKMAEEELLKRGVVQKPAEWSEEDERNIRNLESVLYYDKYLSDETRTELGNFLKSLKPQKQDNNISISPERLKELRDKSFEDGRKAGIVEMAKSMWKPSEEQMGALQVAAMVSQTDFETLTSLLVDLMKLKEDKK